MSASFLATVLIFIATGLVSAFSPWGTSDTFNTRFIAGSLSFVILFNAIFFLYIELFTETDTGTVVKLRQVGPVEWWIRGLNHSILALTWVLLSWGMLFAIGGLLGFYFLLLIWDAIVFRHPVFRDTNNGPYPHVVIHDIGGLLLMFCFAALALYTKQAHEPTVVPPFFFGVIAALFLLNMIFAIRHAPVAWDRLLEERT